MANKFGSQRGVAFALVLMALGAGALMVGPFLNYVSTALTSFRRGSDVTRRYYAADAGIEHAIWELKYGGLELDTPQPYTYSYSSVNGLPVSIQIVNKSPAVDIACQQDEWPGTQLSRVSVTRTVSPMTAPAGVPTIFTVSVQLTNVGTSTIHYQEIGYTMPTGFTYVGGSSSGVTTSDPTQNSGMLAWDFSSPMPSIKSGDTMTQKFSMVGSLSDGEYCAYCDTAWVLLSPESIGCVIYLSGELYDITATAGLTTVQSAVLIMNNGVRVLSWATQ